MKDLVNGYYWALLTRTRTTVHIRKFGDPNKSVLCTSRNNIRTMEWQGRHWEFDGKRKCHKCYKLYLMELMAR